MKDSVLFIFVSESDVDQKVRVRDSNTKAAIELTLSAQRAVVVLQTSDGKIIARYGF